jgi:hypothetical protein
VIPEWDGLLEASAMQSMMFLAQLIGPCLLVVSLSMLSRREAMLALVESMMQNPPLLFVLGVIQMLGGLAIVLIQDVSDGATLPLVLTMLGWWLMLRAVLLMFLSQDALWALFDAMEIKKYHLASNVFGLVIGGYLTYVGFAGMLGITLPFGLSRV